VSFPGSQPTKIREQHILGISQIKQRKTIHDAQLFPYRCHSTFLIEIQSFSLSKKGERSQSKLSSEAKVDFAFSAISTNERKCF
jgi:hypothetical protein